MGQGSSVGCVGLWATERPEGGYGGYDVGRGYDGGETIAAKTLAIHSSCLRRKQESRSGLRFCDSTATITIPTTDKDSLILQRCFRTISFVDLVDQVRKGGMTLDEHVRGY